MDQKGQKISMDVAEKRELCFLSFLLRDLLHFLAFPTVNHGHVTKFYIREWSGTVLEYSSL